MNRIRAECACGATVEIEQGDGRSLWASERFGEITISERR